MKDFFVFKDKNNNKSVKDDYDILQENVWNFFIDNKSKRMKFEKRIGQQDMALDITDAINANEHILVEAGVGIGKSFAYIVPLLYYHQLNKKTLLIATSTIALQEQLIKDIKVISSLIRYDIPIILAKGQSHFLCKKRAEKYLNTVTDNSDYIQEVRLQVKRGNKDRNKLQVPISNELWEKLNVKYFSYSDCSKNCKYTAECTFFQMRKELKNTTGIIVCNQDLLTKHLSKLYFGENLLFPKNIPIIVIDEAHNLEEKVRNSVTFQYSYYTIKKSLYTIINAMFSYKQQLVEESKGFLNSLYKLFKILGDDIKRQQNIDTGIDSVSERYFLNSTDKNIITALRTVTRKAIKVNDIIGMHYENKENLIEIEEAVENISLMKQLFEKIINNDVNYIFWLEANEIRIDNISLAGCPKNIGQWIHKLYFNNKNINVVLTSATMTNQSFGKDKDKYSYFINNTNFPYKERGFISEPKPSPFPYDKHSIIYYSDNLPHPIKDKENFITAASEEIIKLLKITKGKALILFTSKSDMNKVYDILSEKKLKYNILKQNKNSSQEDILSQFKKDVNSVLLGTGTFWEGINIEGRALSNLIIFRLPFPVPEPIIEYKRSISDNPLMEVSVPEMIIKLKQGIGRLIRNNDDKGIVTILDPRVGKKYNMPYYDVVWNSLNIKNKSNDIEYVKKFYDNIIQNNV